MTILLHRSCKVTEQFRCIYYTAAYHALQLDISVDLSNEKIRRYFITSVTRALPGCSRVRAARKA